MSPKTRLIRLIPFQIPAAPDRLHRPLRHAPLIRPYPVQRAPMITDIPCVDDVPGRPAVTGKLRLPGAEAKADKRLPRLPPLPSGDRSLPQTFRGGMFISKENKYPIPYDERFRSSQYDDSSLKDLSRVRQFQAYLRLARLRRYRAYLQ